MATSQTQTDDDLFDHVTGTGPTEEARAVARRYRGRGEIRRVAWISGRDEVRIKTRDVERTLDAMSESGDISHNDVRIEERNMYVTYLRVGV